MPQKCGWVRIDNPMALENLARQVKPVATGGLVEIAQNVGKLQCPAERFGNRMGGRARIAKDVYREMADGACDARAVKVEHSEVRCPNIFSSIHFHPVDDRKKI